MKLGKYKITLANIKGFFQGHYRAILFKIKYGWSVDSTKLRTTKLDELLQDPLTGYHKNNNDFHLIEQASWRLKQVEIKSPGCLGKDGCKKCGCHFPEKAYENRGCELGCYLDIMDKETWEKFKNAK